MRKHYIRKWAHWLHLWLGLVSGAIVFIVALTGCLYVFQHEIQNAFQSYKWVEVQNEPFLSPSGLKLEVASYIYQVPADSANVIYSVTYGKSNQAAVLGVGHHSKGYVSLYLNPYSGKFIHEQVYDTDFFAVVLAGHRNLWLPYAVGHQIVGWGVIIFVIVTLTGIILWIPRHWKKRALKAGLVIKRKSKAFKLFYDLHKVLGFYSAVFALILALTGLTWSFNWYSESYFKVVSGGENFKPWEPAKSDTTGVKLEGNIEDLLWLQVKEEYKPGDHGMLSINFPIGKTDTYRIDYNPANDYETYYKRDFRFFDQYTLQEIQAGGMYGISYDNSTNAEKFYRMTYDIHVGAIGGLLGKFVVFFASFIIAGLPVTGLVIWLKKRKVKRSPTKS